MRRQVSCVLLFLEKSATENLNTTERPKYGLGVVLQTQVDSPTYQNKKFGNVPYVDCVTITMDLRQFSDYQLIEHVIMHDEDLYAVNTDENPNRVIPANCTGSSIENNSLKAVLKHKSWNMIRLGRV